MWTWIKPQKGYIYNGSDREARFPKWNIITSHLDWYLQLYRNYTVIEDVGACSWYSFLFYCCGLCHARLFVLFRCFVSFSFSFHCTASCNVSLNWCTSVLLYYLVLFFFGQHWNPGYCLKHVVNADIGNTSLSHEHLWLIEIRQCLFILGFGHRRYSVVTLLHFISLTSKRDRELIHSCVDPRWSVMSACQ